MKKHRVIIPAKLCPYPKKHEVTAAAILADHLKTDVEFIERSSHKTPDFLIDKSYWELKSPTGKGKRNIQHQLSQALKQSPNIILDARLSKLHIVKIKNELRHQLSHTNSIKKLLLIDKSGQVLEIK